MSIEIPGKWKKGIAFDVHTLSSTYLGTDEKGNDHWDSVRSEMGELVYQLKYNGRRNAAAEIVRLLDRIKGIESMDCILPIPSTNTKRDI